MCLPGNIRRLLETRKGLLVRSVTCLMEQAIVEHRQCERKGAIMRKRGGERDGNTGRSREICEGLRTGEDGRGKAAVRMYYIRDKTNQYFAEVFLVGRCFSASTASWFPWFLTGNHLFAEAGCVYSG